MSYSVCDIFHIHGQFVHATRSRGSVGTSGSSRSHGSTGTNGSIRFIPGQVKLGEDRTLEEVVGSMSGLSITVHKGLLGTVHKGFLDTDHRVTLVTGHEVVGDMEHRAILNMSRRVMVDTGRQNRWVMGHLDMSSKGEQ
jgi:hypothetical protein